jgi:hypothetical protein
MVGIHGGNIEMPGNLVLIDVRAYATYEILGDELTGLLVFVDNGSLPRQKIGDQLLLNVFLQPLIWHVLVIVRGAIENRTHFRRLSDCLLVKGKWKQDENDYRQRRGREYLQIWAISNTHTDVSLQQLDKQVLDDAPIIPAK